MSSSAGILYPLVGARAENYVSFQYLPLSVEGRELRFVIPSWVLSREQFVVGDLVDLHVSFELEPASYFRRVRITSEHSDESLDGSVYSASFEEAERLHESVTLQVKGQELVPLLSQSVFEEKLSSRRSFVVQMLRDIVLLKQGVLVYLKHLVPYSSRIANYPSESYPLLKEQVWKDIAEQIASNSRALEDLIRTIEKKCTNDDDIARVIDLEQLRVSIESEIYYDIFRLTFDSDMAIRYLAAIKELEGKLYSSYNAMLIAFLSPAALWQD